LSQPNVAILVVDDEPLLRIFAVDFLTDAGFMVYEASNAAEAIEVLGSRPNIFAVFTDIQMPGSLDGIGLARHIAKYWPGIFVIVTSGQQAPKNDELADGVPFLAKPYLPETVVAVIRRQLAPQMIDFRPAAGAGNRDSGSRDE
jgi:CheY-like chemotaxis protein